MLLNHPNNLLGKFEESLENIGVCSFSLEMNKPPMMNNPLMWSHYGGEHKGACLLYRFDEEFLNNPDKIVCVDEVQYLHENITNWLKENLNKKSLEILDELNIRDNKEITEEIMDDFLLTYLKSKSPAWGHEKEARIISHKPGSLKVPYGSLRQICFGLRTSQNNIDLIMKIAKEFSGCESFYKLIKDPTSDFGVMAEEIS